MRVRNRIIAGILTAATIGGTVALTGGTAMAATVTCKTTLTHSHSVSSKGTVTDHTTLKKACGKNYDEWEHGYTNSYTGASSTFHLYKDEDYPRWTETRVTRSVSKKGTVTNTTVNSSGG
jgi:hypothetical protein